MVREKALRVDVLARGAAGGVLPVAPQRLGHGRRRGRAGADPRGRLHRRAAEPPRRRAPRRLGAPARVLHFCMDVHLCARREAVKQREYNALHPFQHS